MKKSLVLVALLLASAAASAANPVVEMQTSHGRIVIELDAEKAPKTVDNFLRYVKDDFYRGTIFHRVIRGFMIQGGGFNAEMGQKPTREAIPNEGQNGLKNVRGSIAMARRGDPASATAQFFINHADNSSLDYPQPDGHGYAVFGKVTSGLDVLDKIAAVETGTHRSGHRDVPRTPVFIQSVTLVQPK